MDSKSLDFLWFTPNSLEKSAAFPCWCHPASPPARVCPQSCCHSWERRYQRSSSSKLLRKRHNWCSSNSQNSPSEPWNQLWKASGSSACLWSNFKIHYFILICSSLIIGHWLWWSSWARRLCLASASLRRGFQPFPSLLILIPAELVISKVSSVISFP